MMLGERGGKALPQTHGAWHMAPKKPKSNTAGITGTLDTYFLPDREDGICAWCGEYNTELGYDECCVEDKHAHPNTLTCYKARKLRALSNCQELRKGNIQVSDIHPHEGIAWFNDDGELVWQKMND